jgi:hypothetical protein
MKASLSETGWRGGLEVSTRIPPGCPSHEEAPYGFKLAAIRQAERGGFRTLLWLDSPCVAAGSVDPIFDRIEKEGHLLVTSGERLGNWSSDECLAAFGLSRDQAMSLPLLNGTFLGLDLASERTRRWLDALERACRDGLFRGAYLSDHAPADVRARKPGKPVGFVSPDPRCWGHRHDEAVGSALAHALELAISAPAGIFDTPGAPIRISG